jgi:hypothetical protein
MFLSKKLCRSVALIYKHSTTVVKQQDKHELKEEFFYFLQKRPGHGPPAVPSHSTRKPILYSFSLVGSLTCEDDLTCVAATWASSYTDNVRWGASIEEDEPGCRVPHGPAFQHCCNTPIVTMTVLTKITLKDSRRSENSQVHTYKP